MSEHIFYPMVNQTVKNLVSVAENSTDIQLILYLLVSFPEWDSEKVDNFIQTKNGNSTICFALINELNRQYGRWNKGGNE